MMDVHVSPEVAEQGRMDLVTVWDLAAAWHSDEAPLTVFLS